MNPTIGRVVHYVDGGGAHRAAIVSIVGRESISLTVFDHDGSTYKVPYQSMSETPEGSLNTWHWPERV